MNKLLGMRIAESNGIKKLIMPYGGVQLLSMDVKFPGRLAPLKICTL